MPGQPSAPIAPPQPTVEETPGRTESIETQTRNELVKLAYNSLAIGTWVTVTTAITFALILTGELDTPLLFSWVGYMIFAVGACLILARTYKRAQLTGAEGKTPWGLRLEIATSMIAMGWGATPLL